MNYLAHLFLSEDTPESRIGNLMGDFIESPVPGWYPASMRKGIALHKKIDAYTDSHEIVRLSRQRISIARRRYSGVFVDVFYDHFLAAHWSQYAAIPLCDFTQQIYAALLSNYSLLPDALRQILPDMIQEDWLVSYQEIPGIDKALKRIANRVRGENSLEHAVVELERNYKQFKEDFSNFFPTLVHYVQELISENETTL